MRLTARSTWPTPSNEPLTAALSRVLAVAQIHNEVAWLPIVWPGSAFHEELPLSLSHVCVSHMCGDEGDEVGRSGFVMEPERLSRGFFFALITKALSQRSEGSGKAIVTLGLLGQVQRLQSPTD